MLVMISIVILLTLFQGYFALSVTGCDEKDYEAYLASYGSKNATSNPTYFS